MEIWKVVVVGDSDVGETCLLISYVHNEFPRKHLPTVFDNYAHRMTVRGKRYIIGLWDAGEGRGEDYDTLRPLSYPQTDVFVLCFSVASQASLVNITTKWLPELHYHAPGVPIILVATKIDLRNEPISQKYIPFEEGYNVAKQNNLYYMETSALTRTGLDELFELVTDIFWNASINQKKKGFRGFFSKSRNQKRVLIKPVMPPAAKAPLIEIPTSKYGDHMATGLQDQQATDVVFLLEGVKEVKSHKVILCSACNFFCHVFGISASVEQEDKGEIPFQFTWSDINEGKVAGLSSIDEVENEDGHVITQIGISDDISFTTFSHVLEFLYTGLPKLDGTESEILQELLRVAQIFYLPELKQVIEDGNDFLSPSIGTLFNKRMGQRAKALFLGKETFSDIKFNVQGSIIPAHKAMMASRCEVMAGMFGGMFAESSKGEFHNAKQLANWCLHFVSTNYIAFTERSEFTQLKGHNLDYIEKNRWPPVLFLEEIKKYEAKMEEIKTRRG